MQWMNVLCKIKIKNKTQWMILYRMFCESQFIFNQFKASIKMSWQIQHSPKKIMM